MRLAAARYPRFEPVTLGDRRSSVLDEMTFLASKHRLHVDCGYCVYSAMRCLLAMCGLRRLFSMSSQQTQLPEIESSRDCRKHRRHTLHGQHGLIAQDISLNGFCRKGTMSNTFDRSALTRVCAIINGKGGVGKTTLTANIGGLLALGGWRVLLVDLDFQGNLGRDLGYRLTEGDDNGRALSMAMQFTDQEPAILKDVRPNLDVIVGGEAIEGAAAALQASSQRNGSRDAQLSVARMLAHVAGNYDIVLLDCPPANETIQSAAVAAARYVIIPTKTDPASIDGLEITAGRVLGIKDINPTIDLLGVILFDSSASAKNVRAEISGLIADRLGAPDTSIIFESYVRHAEAVALKARTKGLLVHELDDQVRAAPKWYEQLRDKGADGMPSTSLPKSAEPVADSLQYIANELASRITEREAVHA